MKQHAARFALILVISLTVWVLLFMTSSPPAAPSPSETVGLVAVVAGLVIAGEWVIARIRKDRREP